MQKKKSGKEYKNNGFLSEKQKLLTQIKGRYLKRSYTIKALHHFNN